MKVALDVSAVPDRLTGAGVYVAKLVEALGRRDDVPLVLVARTGDAVRWQTLAPGAEVRAVAPGPRPARIAWEQLVGPRVVRHDDVTLWHGPHYTMPMRLDLPRVVTIHDLTFFDHPEWHERVKVPYFRQMIRWAARHADAVVCVSARTAGRLRELLDVRAEVVVAPHGVDHARFGPSEDVDRDLETLATIGVRPPYVVHLGTIEPRKNVAGLVRAFARVRDAHPALRLVLAGLPGWGATEVDRAIAGAEIGDAVDRLGYVPDDALPALLRRASAVAYPAFEEGFGLPVLEALACGAVVVTSSGTVMEDVAAGAALLAAPGDDVALANALLRALGADTAALRDAGPAVAAAYTWEAAAATHAALYHRL